MSARFEELAWRATPLGEISLRRRRDPVTGAEVYEVKLGDDFLMSSLFTVAEVELARLALSVPQHGALDVVVGGLGLGFTAEAVLSYRDVRDLLVVEALPDVIEWHETGLVPLGPVLTADPRCRLVQGDFFAMVDGPTGLGHRPLHAIIVDIDHSPRHVLHPSHASFYTEAGAARIAALLHPGGVFALWSNDPPDQDYLDVLRTALVDVRAEVVPFPNPLQGGRSTNTVYLGRTAGPG